MSYDLGLILDDAFRAGLPAAITLSDYNEAVSLQAALKRHMKHMTDNAYKDFPDRNPFLGILVSLERPSTLRIERVERLKVVTRQGTGLPGDSSPTFMTTDKPPS